MFEKNLFKDLRVLVTGGGSGIGFSIAQQYLQLGASVIIASRNQEKLDKAKNKLEEYGHVLCSQCDIRNEEEIAELVNTIKSEFGGLDILINNAGGQFLSPAEGLSNKGWDAVIRNNLNGTWYMTRAIADAFFIPQKSGRIINIIINIFRGSPGMIHSGAARAGVDSLTKTLAVEWSKYNIQVNAVAPGLIYSTGFKQYPKEFLSNIENKVPAKRLGSTQEVANLVLFLTSQGASYITGETVYIDGGWHLHGDVFELS